MVGSLGGSLRPLDCERVNFLRADVAGEDRRTVGGNAYLGVPVWADGARPAFQAGEHFHLVISEPDAHRLWFRAPGAVVHVPVIWRMSPVDDTSGSRTRHQVRPFLGLKSNTRSLYGLGMLQPARPPQPLARR